MSFKEDVKLKALRKKIKYLWMPDSVTEQKKEEQVRVMKKKGRRKRKARRKPRKVNKEK